MGNFIFIFIFYLFFPGFNLAAKSKPVNQTEIISVVLSEAEKYKVPGPILLVICLHESLGDPLAYRHQDKSADNHAFGLCQVLYKTAKQFGLKNNDRCEQDFNITERTADNCALFELKTNIKYAALYLKHQLTRYNNNLISAIAAYNSGTFRVDTNGIKNQKYLNKVFEKLTEIYLTSKNQQQIFHPEF